jgi:CRISPR-associated protein Cmr4
MIQGSGLKGALRHHLRVLGQSGNDAAYGMKLAWVFGPDGGDEGRPQDHAGAVAFGDGKLLLFPVRSLVGTFAYCTSALALGRLRRDMELTGIQPDKEFRLPPAPGDGRALAPTDSKILDGNVVVLEDFEVQVDKVESVSRIANWIADSALPGGDAFHYFKERIKSHLVILDDNLFGHLVRQSTVVEPHVKIDDATGTASEGAFFYAEHLPPDSLLWCLVGVGRPRARSEDQEALKKLGLGDAQRVEAYLRDQFDGRPVQIGAEATTGRGLVHLRLAGGGSR